MWRSKNSWRSCSEKINSKSQENLDEILTLGLCFRWQANVTAGRHWGLDRNVRGPQGSRVGRDTQQGGNESRDRSCRFHSVGKRCCNLAENTLLGTCHWCACRGKVFTVRSTAQQGLALDLISRPVIVFFELLSQKDALITFPFQETLGRSEWGRTEVVCSQAHRESCCVFQRRGHSSDGEQ